MRQSILSVCLLSGFTALTAQQKVKKDSIKNLQEVELVGRLKNDYTSDYSFSTMKNAEKNLSIPQAVSTITKELMADRAAFFLGDAVRLVSGVVPSSYYNQYAIRGISQNEEGQILNGMRTRQHYFLQPITSHIERVEVVKGPASATFSSIDPGGSVNMVTKKPLNIDRKEVTLGMGSFATYRTALDFTGPLNTSKTLLYRLNAAYQEGNSFRDLVNNKAILVSPSITYVPSENTKINAEFIFSDHQGKLDRGQPIFGATKGADLNSTPIGLNLAQANDFFKSKELIMTLSASQKINQNISLNAQYMKQTWLEDLQEHRTTNAFPVDKNGKAINSMAQMRFVQRQQNWNVDNASVYANFNYLVDDIEFKMTTGYDLSMWHKLIGSGQNTAQGYLLKNGTSTNRFVVADVNNYVLDATGTMPKPNVPHFNLANPDYTIRNASDYILNKTSLPAALTQTDAVYLQNNIKYRGLNILMSIRHEWFKDLSNYNSKNEFEAKQTALLPRFGVSYEFTKNISAYVTYLTGFQGQSNTTGLMPLPAPPKTNFPALTSELKEFGVKSEFFGGKLKANAAVYEIRQKNILVNANDPTNPDLLATRGEEKSLGFEMDVNGQILPNFNIYASYSYIDARIVADSNPALIDARKQNTPYNSANFWGRYNFSKNTPLNGFGLGFGWQHSGAKVPWFTRDFKVPSYNLLDAAVYYQPQGSQMQLSLNVNNLANHTYWLGAQNYLRLFPGAPRNYMLTLVYKF